MSDITITQPALPADLPENWTNLQYVSAGGTETGLSQQHGYNYLMKQVNDAQTAVNTLAEQAQEAVSGLESGALTATATRSGTTVAITGPEDAVTVTFLAPADWTEGDSYTYNGTPVTVTDLNGNPVTDGWKQGAVLTFQISGGVAYFVGGASGSFLPLSGGTMTGPAVGAAGALGTAQFRNVQYGTEPLTPGESPLPQGTLYITPEVNGGAGNWQQVVDNDSYTLKINESAGLALLMLKPISEPPTGTWSVPSTPQYGSFSIVGKTYQIVPPESPNVIPAAYRPVNPYSENKINNNYSSSININGNLLTWAAELNITRNQGYVAITVRGIYNGTENFDLELPEGLTGGGLSTIYPYSAYNN
uniref:Uncharacterized protein n=1 Tax=Myoviridae sp. ctHP32 TaxID=2823539 RepID=A0A8S5LFU8_9CAUD|nr:MAG TPA: hypothetical protein [Myoviridae sp. ctHP32]